MIASMAVVLALGSGTAMAAEVGNDIGDPNSGYVLGEVGKEFGLYADLDGDGIPDMLKELNPDNTDEDWEIYKMLENPQANGLVEVGNVTYEEDGVLFEQKIYAPRVDPVMPPIGQSRFYGYTRVYKNINDKKSLLWKTYLSADIAWDVLKKDVSVVDNSISAWNQRIGDSDFVIKCDAKNPTSKYIQHNFKKAIEVDYEIILYFKEGNPKTYTTKIAVNYQGEEIIGGIANDDVN